MKILRSPMCASTGDVWSKKIFGVNDSHVNSNLLYRVVNLRKVNPFHILYSAYVHAALFVFIQNVLDCGTVHRSVYGKIWISEISMQDWQDIGVRCVDGSFFSNALLLLLSLAERRSEMSRINAFQPWSFKNGDDCLFHITSRGAWSTSGFASCCYPAKLSLARIHVVILHN